MAGLGTPLLHDPPVSDSPLLPPPVSDSPLLPPPGRCGLSIRREIEARQQQREEALRERMVEKEEYLQAKSLHTALKEVGREGMGHGSRGSMAALTWCERPPRPADWGGRKTLT